MMKIAWLLVLPLLAAHAAAKPELNDLPAPVTKVLAKHRLPPDTLGVFIQDVAKKEPLLTFNADTPRNPASVIKVLTSYIALDMLGPTYTWRTEAYASGPINKGQLKGDLILKGYGDPFLVTESFWKILRGLRDRGLQHIDGDLVVDNQFFAPPAHDPGAFDGKPYRPYNVGADALLLNFQIVNFAFVPDSRTRQVQIAPDPRPANLKIINKLKYVGGKCRGRKQPIQMQVSQNSPETSVAFTGRYLGNCGELILPMSILQPAALVYGVFKTQWVELGGTLAGKLRIAAKPKGARRLFTLQSRPLAEILRGVNKFSNNAMARQLLLTMGAERFGAPGTLEKGRTAIEQWLKGQQLEFPELFVDNGSGLSRRTRISARSLGQFLVKAHSLPFIAEFESSLPIAAVDGTLRRRFRGETLARWLRMKTGTLNGVRGIAGYLVSGSGKIYAVAVLQNHPGVHQGLGTQVQNVLLRWLFKQ